MHPMLFPVPSDDASESNMLIFPSLFRETMDMIFESYDYFELHDTIDKDLLPRHTQTLISNEMSRITMRLTSVMAWLMARKAVVAGQISPDDATANYRIDGEEYCLARYEDLYEVTPDYLVDLLERSYQLYLRVWRLDQQHNEQT